MKIIMQPASPNNNAIVAGNLRNTIESPVDCNRIVDILSEGPAKRIKSVFEEEGLNEVWVWGVLPKHRDKWETFNPDDLTIFGGYKEVSFQGTILDTVESQALAQNLWQDHPEEGPFACIYFLKNLRPVHGDKDSFSNIRKLANPANTGISWQGLMLIQDEPSVLALSEELGHSTENMDPDGISQPGRDKRTPGRSKSSLLEEGAEVEARGKRRKRSIALRDAARAYFAGIDKDKSLRCHACGYSTPDELKDVREIIQIHHKDMISEQDTNGKTIDLNTFDFDEHLIPLCPTCHVIAHSESPPLELSKIRQYCC